jgi:hypothetical protein
MLASDQAALGRNFARLAWVNDSALIPGNNVNIRGARRLGAIFERRRTGVPFVAKRNPDAPTDPRSAGEAGEG